jgi:hypothetical protein
MKIIKMQVKPGEERILEIGGKFISLQEIKLAMNVIMLFVLVALAYNYGQHDALEYQKWIASHTPLCKDGICQSCTVRQFGNSLEWICEFKNQTKPQESSVGVLR